MSTRDKQVADTFQRMVTCYTLSAMLFDLNPDSVQGTLYELEGKECERALLRYETDSDRPSVWVEPVLTLEP